MPSTEADDALHIALAVVNGIEYLVTWNFKHIANAAMTSKIESVCIAQGYAFARSARPKSSWSQKPMFEDPIVEEIRRIRHAHAAQFNFDIRAIVEDLRRSQRESGLTYVNFPPRLLKEESAAGSAPSGDQPAEPIGRKLIEPVDHQVGGSQ
ncbi:MAG: hypothetical protein ABSG86_20810 [Thermoguttaceae bacterium]